MWGMMSCSLMSDQVSGTAAAYTLVKFNRAAGNSGARVIDRDIYAVVRRDRRPGECAVACPGSAEGVHLGPQAKALMQVVCCERGECPTQGVPCGQNR